VTAKLCRATRHALLAAGLCGVSGCAHHHAEPRTPAPSASAAAPTPMPAAGARWCDSVPRPAFQALQRVPVHSAWFVVYAVDPGVLAITEPYQFQEVISYLILGTNRALLFDTGLGIGSISTVVRELTSLPVSVLNSHTHYDHVGGNAEFDHILARDTPYTAANSRGFSHQELAGEVAPDALCRPLPAGFDSTSFHTRPYAPTERVADGTRIELGDRTVEVLETPGHTPDAVALVDRAAGLLWTGDSFYEGTIWLIAPETDLDAYARSVDRMAALVPSLRKVLGAHKVAVSDPRKLLTLKDAIAQVRTGRARGADQGGDRVKFPFDGFSLLLARPLLSGRHGDRTKGGSGLTAWPK
jgi:glyoxylase-like metal-dependent hydrolase (beta-lactamase superfamily II)